MSNVEPDPLATGLGRVLRGLLRPLVKVMIASGLTAPAAFRLLKEVFVQVAEQELVRAERGRRPTDSRISVMTGVHRKDVRAIRAAGPGEEPGGARRVSVLASVIGRWLGGRETTDPDGEPLALPRTGEGASFERLVASVSKDVRARTLLDELTRQGLAQLDPATDRVTLRTDAFLGPAEFEQKAHFFAANVGDHIAAAAENLLAEAPPFLERAVFYNRLTPTSVAEIEALARARGAALLIEVNRLAHARQAADLESAGATERFRFGLFFYRRPDERGESDDDAGPPSGPAPTPGGEDDGRT